MTIRLLIVLALLVAAFPALPRLAQPPAAGAVRVSRFATNPLVTVKSATTLGANVNGPTVIRVPAWVERPLGSTNVLGNHRGDFIRLAYPTPSPDRGRSMNRVCGTFATRRCSGRSPTPHALAASTPTSRRRRSSSTRPTGVSCSGRTDGGPTASSGRPSRRRRSGGRTKKGTVSSRNPRSRLTASNSRRSRRSRRRVISASFSAAERCTECRVWAS